MRPYWKGYLKLALVSCPIALHAACSTAERIAFRQINKAIVPDEHPISDDANSDLRRLAQVRTVERNRRN